MRYTVGMSAPIFIRLTPEEDARLRELENNPLIHPKVRLRALEIRLSAQGWTAPKIAEFVGRGHSTVLLDLGRWLERGFEGLADGKAPGAAPKITPEVEAYLRELLAQDRIWTAPQLCEAIFERFGLKVDRSTITRHLQSIGYVYKRTRYVPIGKPDPEEVEMFRSEENRVKRGRLKA
jgi:transposase